jgi:hypothetical protein
MKQLFLSLMAALPLVASAQQDTLQQEAPESTRRLELGVNSKEGGYVKVTDDGDTTAQTNGGPLTITTKRKKITITSEYRRTSETDSLGERLGDLRKDRRRTFTYWSGIDVGVNTLLGPDGDADLDREAEFMEIDNSRSRFLAINVWERKLEFGSHHAGLFTGLGMEFVNYRLKNNVLLQYNGDSVFALPLDTIDLRKNKLRQIGLRVPLMLEFNTKRAPLPSDDEARAGKREGFSRKGNVHLAAGLVGSWYFDTMYKQRFRLDGEDRKPRDKGDYHLRPYRLAATARVGYGAWNFFAEYALTSLFKDGKGPELTPFNVGLTIIGFN